MDILFHTHFGLLDAFSLIIIIPFCLFWFFLFSSIEDTFLPAYLSKRYLSTIQTDAIVNQVWRKQIAKAAAIHCDGSQVSGLSTTNTMMACLSTQLCSYIHTDMYQWDRFFVCEENQIDRPLHTIGPKKLSFSLFLTPIIDLPFSTTYFTSNC